MLLLVPQGVRRMKTKIFLILIVETSAFRLEIFSELKSPKTCTQMPYHIWCSRTRPHQHLCISNTGHSNTQDLIKLPIARFSYHRAIYTPGNKCQSMLLLCLPFTQCIGLSGLLWISEVNWLPCTRGQSQTTISKIIGGLFLTLCKVEYIIHQLDVKFETIYLLLFMLPVGSLVWVNTSKLWEIFFRSYILLHVDWAKEGP